MKKKKRNLIRPGNDVVERERAEWEHRSIGPHGSAVVMGPDGIDVYLKVRWDDRLEHILGLGDTHEEIESATTWQGWLQDGVNSCGVEIEWPDSNVTVLLYFGLKEYAVELGILHDAQRLVLVPTGKSTLTSRGIVVQCETPEWLPTLIEFQKAPDGPD